MPLSLTMIVVLLATLPIGVLTSTNSTGCLVDVQNSNITDGALDKTGTLFPLHKICSHQLSAITVASKRAF